jgi:hypothetical protein
LGIEIGLERSAEIFSTIPLRLGHYLLEEFVGHRPESSHSNPATIGRQGTDSLASEEGKPKAVQAYTDIVRC